MKIDIDLSADSFLSAAKQLRDYADSLQGKSEQLVQWAGEMGLENAANSLGHVDTGETVGSLDFKREGAKGTISVGGNAVWIEFGTGVYRNGSVGSYPHPKAQELGMYAIGTYGYGYGANPEGWFYRGADGKKHFTQGIQCNPFMYNAAQDIRRELLDMAKEVFKSD